MKKLILFLSLFIGFIWASYTFAEDCTSNPKYNNPTYKFGKKDYPLDLIFTIAPSTPPSPAPAFTCDELGSQPFKFIGFGRLSTTDIYRYRNIVVGLRLEGTDNKIYVWKKVGASIKLTFLYTTTLPSGYPDPNNVITNLDFIQLANVDSDNADIELIGYSSSNNTIRIWHVPAPDESEPETINNPTVTNVSIDKHSLKAMIAGNFNDDSVDEIMTIEELASTIRFTIFGWNGTTLQELKKSTLRGPMGGKLNPSSFANTNYFAARIKAIGNSKDVLLGLTSNEYFTWADLVNNDRSTEKVIFCNTQGGGFCPGKKIVFKIDQAFANGLLANYTDNYDTYKRAFERIISVLTSFKNKGYDVYISFIPIFWDDPNPRVSDRKKLNDIIQLLIDKKIKFILDVYSSDANGIGSRTQYDDPRYADQPPGYTRLFDLSHGNSLRAYPGKGEISPMQYPVYPDLSQEWATTLKSIKAKDSGAEKYFAGLRFHEIMWYSIFLRNFLCENCLPDKICKPACAHDLGTRIVPETSYFFEKDILSRYLYFAYLNSMFIYMSDPTWSAPNDGLFSEEMTDYTTKLNELSVAYSNTLFTTYSNNNSFMHKENPLYYLNNWETFFPKKADGTASYTNFGLSNQSWQCGYTTIFSVDNCPNDLLIVWSNNALVKKDASLLQFEPSWYFFKWQDMVNRHNLAPIPYRGNEDFWIHKAGCPTQNLKDIADSLGVINLGAGLPLCQ